MAHDILENKVPSYPSTTKDKKWANVLLRMYKEACYNPNVYGEWHHIAAICMFGSIDDLRNYIRLRPELHLMVHAALCYFFPSILSLSRSLIMMLDGAKKGNISKNLSKEELDNYLKRADEEKEIFGFAKRLNAEATSVRTKKLHAMGRIRLIPKGASKGTEAARLKAQRRQLRIKGIYLSGPYTQAEIDLYISRYPPTLGIEFFHFPQDSREARQRKHEDELDEEDMVDLESTDIVTGVNLNCDLLQKQEGNIELTKQIDKYHDEYMEAPAKMNKYTTSQNVKQAICYKILHLLEDSSYRFVTAVDSRDGIVDNYRWFEPTHKVIVHKIGRMLYNLKKGRKRKQAANDNPPSGTYCDGVNMKSIQDQVREKMEQHKIAGKPFPKLPLNTDGEVLLAKGVSQSNRGKYPTYLVWLWYKKKSRYVGTWIQPEEAAQAYRYAQLCASRESSPTDTTTVTPMMKIEKQNETSTKVETTTTTTILQKERTSTTTGTGVTATPTASDNIATTTTSSSRGSGDRRRPSRRARIDADRKIAALAAAEENYTKTTDEEKEEDAVYDDNGDYGVVGEDCFDNADGNDDSTDHPDPSQSDIHTTGVTPCSVEIVDTTGVIPSSVEIVWSMDV